MRAHLCVSWITLPANDLRAVEQQALDILDPSLNLAGRPKTPIRLRVSELRRVATQTNCAT